MAEILVKVVEGSAELEDVRGLMREYGAWLASVAEICLAGLDGELAGLPRPYEAPGGLLLATIAGAAAGCAGLKPLGAALELKRLWVRPEFRGLGLGRRLMEAALAHARAAGAEAVLLDTVPGAMPEANRMYEALGFRQVERYNDTPVDAVRFFRLELAGRSAGGGG